MRQQIRRGLAIQEDLCEVFKPSGAMQFDNSGYDHKEGMKSRPPQSHAHHDEVNRLGLKYAGSWLNRSDSGGSAMHHVYQNDNHEVHLISSLGSSGTTHTYNVRGRNMYTTSGQYDAPKSSTIVSVYKRGVNSRIPLMHRHVEPGELGSAIKSLGS